jgi:hypothetical protein
LLADAMVVGELLGTVDGAVHVDDALARVLVRSGRPSPRRAVLTRWVMAAATVGVVAIALRSQSAYSDDRWADDLQWLMNPDAGQGKAVRMDDRQFIGRLHELQQQGTLDLVEDECCDDRDGEGPADDGLVLVTLAQQDAGLAVIYEDIDRSGSLTSGDLIRLVSRTVPPPVTLERHGPQFRPGSLP